MSNRRAVVTSAPRTTPAVVPAAALVALLLLAGAVVAVRDLAVAQGWATGEPWVTQAVGALDDLRATPEVVAAGVVAALVGLVLLVLAVRPGARTHVRAAGDAELWLTPRALGALAAATVNRTEGVVAVEVARATRRRVVVETVTQPGPSGTGGTGRGVEAAREAVAAGPGQLTPVRVVVEGREVPS